MEPSILNPPVPYLGFINGGFRPGRIVRVQGRVNHNSHGFKIELLCGSNPNHDDVALHFNPRFSESVVIRNSRNYSTWGTEERQGNSFPFVRGQVYEVLILCEQQHFKIAINGQHYAEFTHRVPVERITYLAVDGDITISFIQFDGAPDSSAPQAPPDAVASAPPLLQGGNYGEQYPSYGHGHGNAAPGFVPPPYPTGGSMGAPPFPPQQPGYMPQQGIYGPPQGSYPPSPHGPHSYPPPGQGYGMPGTYPGQYPPPQQPYGAYPPQQYPSQQPPYHQGGGGGGGIMDTAGKVLAGVGLAGVASKLPGMMGGGHKQGYSGYPPGHGGGGSGFPGGVGGAAAGLGALGLGGALAAKVLKPKKLKKNKKMLKYGLPLAGAGIGGYALTKGMHGFRRSSSSSSSSSSD